VAIGASEGLVPVEECLHGVGPRAERAQRLQRVAENRPVDDRGRSRGQAVDVEAEDLLRLRAVGDLEARLRGLVGGEEQQHTAGDR
jgi:hypothetical protein